MPEPDPAVYLNPWYVSPASVDVVTQAVRWCANGVRRRFEVRRLGRIAVLPTGWDAAGRHHGVAESRRGMTRGHAEASRPGAR